LKNSPHLAANSAEQPLEDFNGAHSASEYAVNHQVKTAILKLVGYCRAEGWAGYDPYDALNSKIFQALPILNSRYPRLVLTQGLKSSPFDVRGLLLVPKTQNAKAIALFLSAFLRLSENDLADCEQLVRLMVERLVDLRSPDNRYWCWGYSFPWQTRTIVVPAGSPNLVCTSYAAAALLDAYEQRQDRQCLTMAVSAADYILDKLYWVDGNSTCGFSYPQPGVRSRTHNANLLAAAFLCRVYKHTGEKRFLGPAMRVARYSAANQQEDGSWYYGEAPSQRWIDNFHTGYNLSALQQIDNCLEIDEFESRVQSGFEFYKSHFIREDGAARYFHDKTYPIDIHCVAQSIITLIEFKRLEPRSDLLARSVFVWAMKHMWDDRGFFYYRVLRSCTIRTSYMRWSQAWMLLALSTMLSESDSAAEHSRFQEAPAFVKA
jgi:hypothetical protein